MLPIILHLRPTSDTVTFHVFRDDPAWEAVTRWYDMRLSVLERLYIGTYDFPGTMDVKVCRELVRGEHPDSILIRGCVW